MPFIDRRRAGAAAVRYRVRVSRLGEARGLTHLAQIERLRRAVAVSGLPVVMDKRRRKPRSRLAFGPAISLGYESLAEYFDLELVSARTVEEIAAALGPALGEGFAVRAVRRIPRFYPSLDASINVVRYDIEGAFPEDRRALLESFLAREKIVIEKLKAGGARRERVDVRPLIREMEFDSPRRLRLTLRFGPKRTVKPEAVLREWLGLGGVMGLPGGPAGPVREPLDGFRIRRMDLFSETARGELLSP